MLIINGKSQSVTALLLTSCLQCCKQRIFRRIQTILYC